eukprot:scaffold96872_cov14-Tisochrysis_lutea.AAC.1
MAFKAASLVACMAVLLVACKAVLLMAFKAVSLMACKAVLLMKIKAVSTYKSVHTAFQQGVLPRHRAGHGCGNRGRARLYPEHPLA